jgi:hypothetical protein
VHKSKHKATMQRYLMMTVFGAKFISGGGILEILESRAKSNA